MTKQSQTAGPRSPRSSRRRWLGGIVRGSLGAGLVAVVATLTFRQGKGSAATSCAGDRYCAKCGQVPRCVRPESRSYRRAHETKREDHHDG